MTQIPLFLYTKFHLFLMKYEKAIAFNIPPFEKKSHKPTYSLFSYGTINPPYNNLDDKKSYHFMSMQFFLETSENHCPYQYNYIFGAKKVHLFIINCGFKPNMTSYFKLASHIYAPFSGLATWQMVNFSLLSI